MRLVLARLPSQFAGRTREEVTVEGEAAGVRVTPVLTPAEVLANEHVRARGTFLDVAVAGTVGKVVAGVHAVGGVRSTVPGCSGGRRRAAPLAGPAGPEHRPPTGRPAPPAASGSSRSGPASPSPKRAACSANGGPRW